MVKTRSQVASVVIKREESEDESKASLLLNGISDRTRNRRAISKRKTSTVNKNSRLSTSEVKSEERKPTIISQQSPKKNKPQGRDPITKVQIQRLIGFIENDKMSLTKASKEVNIHVSTGSRYYNMYKIDPNCLNTDVPYSNISSYEQVKSMIGYIVDDGMTLKNASDKAKMCLPTARKYYNIYLADPNHDIPRPQKKPSGYIPPITYDQVKALIGYIEDDKMTISAASAKANMSTNAGRSYHWQYLNSPNHEIPIPRRGGKNDGKACSYEQIKALIGYIVDEKMSITEASSKTGMRITTGKNYYLKYLNDPNHEIPTPKKPPPNPTQFYSYDKVKAFIDCIERDNMTIEEASQKVNMDSKIGEKYYSKYINDPDRNIPVKKKTAPLSKRCTQDQIKLMIGYVDNDNMTITAAAKKANMSEKSGTRYYGLYRKDPNRAIPAPLRNTIKSRTHATSDQIKKLIGYIVDDNMTIEEALEKANLSTWSGKKFYKKYLDDPNHEIPHPFNPANNTGQCSSHEKVKALISLIVDDNMSIRAAAKEVNMSNTTASKYYYRYLNNPKKEVAAPEIDNSNRVCPKRYNQVKDLIKYIVDGKMSVVAAAEKTDIPVTTACKYYKRYLKDPERKIPIPTTPHKTPTREQLSDLIKYVENDKLSIIKAGKLVGIAKHTSRRYYKMYKDDPNHRIPDPSIHSRQINGFVRKHRGKKEDSESTSPTNGTPKNNSSIGKS
ncbi:hypothetical protein K501DRAFT_270871 [Backusella circina FSU 941]|nr:hypothetical protein K501DRAFT_270871 [Backusella circina FSU 941]